MFAFTRGVEMRDVILISNAKWLIVQRRADVDLLLRLDAQWQEIRIHTGQRNQRDHSAQ